MAEKSNELNHSLLEVAKAFGAMIVIVGIIALITYRFTPPRQEPIPAPPVFCLKPGQSAYLLEDVIVNARIPYQDKELYVGKVKLEKGAFLMKPVVE